MSSKNLILSAEIAEKKLLRMAYEIAERNSGESSLVLAAIKDSGVVIAKKIQKLLANIFNGQVTMIEIYLDKKNPAEINILPEIPLNDSIIILVDDVANSGRTLLYSLKPFLEYYPKKIQTLVLVERTHKLFPVKSDYVGLSVATTLQDNIIVEVSGDEITGAWLQ